MGKHVKCLARTFRKQKWGYLFMLPAMVFFTAFVLLPFLRAVQIGFYDYSLTTNRFIGLENYVNLFKDSIFIQSLLNTLKYVVMVVPVTAVLAFLIAFTVYNCTEKLRSFVRGAFYLPAIIPAVCLAMVWRWMYNPVYGLFKNIMEKFGLPAVDFLGDGRYALVSVAVVVITWSIGQPIILYIAAIGGIPENIHEAAKIDGANKLQRIIHITLPLLKPTTLYILIILTIGAMQIVEVIILMTSGGPYYATSTMLFLIYQYAFKLAKFGYAAAIGNIMFVIIFILSFIQYKWLSDNEQY